MLGLWKNANKWDNMCSGEMLGFDLESYGKGGWAREGLGKAVLGGVMWVLMQCLSKTHVALNGKWKPQSRVASTPALSCAVAVS